MEFEWIESFEYLLKQAFGAVESVGDPAPHAKITEDMEECAYQIIIFRVIQPY